MKKTHLDDKLHTIRVIPHHQIWIAAHRATFWPIVAGILVIVGLMAGYLAGNKDLDQAYTLSEAAGLAQMQISRAAERTGSRQSSRSTSRKNSTLRKAAMMSWPSRSMNNNRRSTVCRTPS